MPLWEWPYPRGWSISFSISEYNDDHKFLNNDRYRVEKVLFYSKSSESGYFEWILGFLKYFSLFIGQMFSPFKFLNIMDYIYLFWMLNSHCFLYNIILLTLLTLLFSCNFFMLFWNQWNSDLRKQEQTPLHFSGWMW